MGPTLDLKSPVQINRHVPHTTHTQSSFHIAINYSRNDPKFIFVLVHLRLDASACCVMLGISFLQHRPVDHQWWWLTAEYFYAFSTKPQSHSARRTHILVYPQPLSSHDDSPSKPNFRLHYCISVRVSHIKGKTWAENWKIQCWGNYWT